MTVPRRAVRQLRTGRSTPTAWTKRNVPTPSGTSMDFSIPGNPYLALLEDF